MAGGKKGSIAAIDLTRFLCALLVVAHHYAAMFPMRPESLASDVGAGADLATDWAWWSWTGWIGVELFFVISGYVIAISAANSTPRAFLKRRLLRLAPVAWICASVTAVALVMAGGWPLAQVAVRWLTSLLFWPTLPQIDGSYWTLGIEVNFYLLIALQLCWRGGGVRGVERIGMALAVVSAGYWLLRIDGMVPAADRLTDLSLLPHGGLFAAGIALSALRDRGVSAMRVAMLVLGLASGSAEIVAADAFFAHGLGFTPQPAVPLAIFAAGVAFIAAADRLQPMLVRVFGAERIAFAGLMTYPLYLIHQHAGAVLIVALRRHGVESHVAMIATAAVMLALAAAITGLAERPARRALDRFISRRGSPRDTRPSASLPAG
jgi:peptidoglycan/LPS O-acetylase OafA/YrhL